MIVQSGRMLAIPFLLALQMFVHTAVLGGTLDHDLAAILQAPALAGSISGVEVVEVRTGKVLFASDSDIRLVPASNRKLFTAALAMETLGPDYKLSTTLLGPPADATGVVRGDLRLLGGGDGLFSSDDAMAMAKQVYDAGVRTVVGNVIGDGSLFTDGPYPDAWGWDTLSDYYAPEISGLEIDEGVMNVAVAAASSASEPPTISVDGPPGYVSIDNRATTGLAGSANTLDVSRTLGSDTIAVTGIAPIGYSSKEPFVVTVHDPSAYAAAALRQALSDVGIAVENKRVDQNGAAKATPLAEHDSVALSDYLPKMMKPSDNLLAESLLRVVGARSGHGGSFDSAETYEKALLTQSGISDNDYAFADGSGVSRMNLVTPRAIVGLLLAVSKKPWFTAYYDALPIGGVDGTLKHRMETGAAHSNAHAKTGTVRHDHCLSGYVTTADGRMLAFSIMNNNYIVDPAQINKIQDAIVERLAEEK